MRAPKRLMAVLLAAVTTGVLMLSVEPAHAAYCYEPTNHCYAQMQWNVSGGSSGFHGSSAVLRTNCMDVSTPTSQQLTNHLLFAQGNYWVEAGITIGPKSGGGYLTQPTLYWADNRPNGTYIEHFGASYSLNTNVTAKIDKTATASSWSVSVGSLASTSTSNFSSYANGLETGVETNYDTGHTYGSSSSLQFRSLTDSWVSGWSGALPYADATDQTGLTVAWVTTPTWARASQGAAC